MLDVRQLEGWVTFPEAAEALGISKQGMHKLVFESPNAPFTSSEVKRLGAGPKPVYLLLRGALDRVRAERSGSTGRVSRTKDSDLEIVELDEVPGPRPASD